MIKSEVLIIGGGIIGCSIAYYLAAAGVRAVLVEQDSIASGASGACDGFVFLQSKSPGIHLELASESAALYEKLSSELGYDLEYNRCGGMVVAENQDELDYLDCLVKEQQRFGLNVEMLSKAATRSKVPGLASHIKGASFCDQEAQVNPIAVTRAFAGKACTLGAKVMTRAKVTGIEISERRNRQYVQSVTTSKGKIRADLVINAAGVEASKICRLIGIDLPLTPRRGQILVTEPLPAIMDCLIMNVSYITAKFCPTVRVAASGCGVTFEQTKAGNLLIGSTREFVGYNKRTTYEGMTTIASNAVKLLPQSKSHKVIRSFAGLRPHTPDNLAIMGEINGIQNFIVCSGHEGDGIALAPITGKLVAELIVEGTTSIDLSELGPGRFADRQADRKRK